MRSGVRGIGLAEVPGQFFRCSVYGHIGRSDGGSYDNAASDPPSELRISKLTVHRPIPRLTFLGRDNIVWGLIEDLCCGRPAQVALSLPCRG
jgi:hypothetical protein